MKRRYLVVYEHGKRNYSGFAPDVPGCISTGRDLPTMRRMMREALEAHLQWMANDGDEIPEARTMQVEFTDEDIKPNNPDHYFVVEWLEVKLPVSPRMPQTMTA
jgi:predicted RNase H-like HicB family nuclease